MAVRIKRELAERAGLTTRSDQTFGPRIERTSLQRRDAHAQAFWPIISVRLDVRNLDRFVLDELVCLDGDERSFRVPGQAHGSHPPFLVDRSGQRFEVEVTGWGGGDAVHTPAEEVVEEVVAPVGKQPKLFLVEDDGDEPSFVLRLQEEGPLTGHAYCSGDEPRRRVEQMNDAGHAVPPPPPTVPRSLFAIPSKAAAAPVIDAILRCGPIAIADTKRLIGKAAEGEYGDAMAEMFAGISEAIGEVGGFSVTVRDDLRGAGIDLDTIDPPPPGFSECLFPQERQRVIDDEAHEGAAAQPGEGREQSLRSLLRLPGRAQR